MNDSVWVDIDLPLITSPEGKLLKALVAYHIEDLDSRLDMNAVGNLAQNTLSSVAGAYVANTGTNNSYAAANGSDLPQGFGVGAAESSLRHFFGSDADYATFLQSRYGGGTPGTNNVDDLRSRLNGGGDVFIAALGGTRNTGTRGRRKIFRHDQLPGLPVSIRGGYALGLDRLGNPLLLRGTLPFDQGTDDPYEARLRGTPHHDLPIDLAEWERMTRIYDWDRSMLPRRLESFGPIANNVRRLTPRSAHTRHVPLAATTPTGTPATSFMDLMQSIGRFRSTPINLSNAAYAELFPLEFHRGLAMDLNRPLGNGMDDDLDGAIDEPQEVAQGQRALYFLNGEVQPTMVNEFSTLSFANLDFPNFGVTTGNVDPDFEFEVGNGNTLVANFQNGQQSRQLMARHLYCLAMLMLPDELYPSNRPAGTALTGDARARALAQWAVNVVDFRDADHAMTRFPYDPHPFTEKTLSDGKKVFWLPNRDDSGAANGEVVWGMEQPELLITETGAFHDLRVRDTTEDDGGMKKTDASSSPDDDYDQYRMPQGSLFLELLCPRTTRINSDQNAPGVAASGAMYTIDAANNVVLNVGALSPSDGTTQYPVWRVAMSEPHPDSEETPDLIINGAGMTGSQPILPHEATYQLAVDTN
ncbi:MAG: hypothetical protein KDA45_15185, partial [Planctomycetales bacterium]|nr:hypothetical protein [Planctomycetales bacterium]